MDVCTLLALAQNAVDMGNVNAACEFYEVGLQQSPNNDEVLEAYAEILIHFGKDLVRAEKMLRHAVSVNPNEGYVKYLNLAQLCGAEEAVRHYRTAYSIAERMLGKCKQKKQKKALTEAMSTMCVAVAELYLTDLCFAPDAESNCEQAIQCALKMNSRSVEAHQAKGSLLLSQSQPEEAVSFLSKAVELTRTLGEEYQPTYESKLELARLLMQVNPAEAFTFLLELLQLNDMNPYVWFLLGECARMRKRFVDSARLLRRARVLLLLSYTQNSSHGEAIRGQTANSMEEGGSTPVLSDEDAAALQEIDQAIGVLVQEMGGPEIAAQIPQLDCTNPLELLEEDEEESMQRENEERESVDENPVLNEPTWEPLEAEEERV